MTSEKSETEAEISFGDKSLLHKIGFIWMAVAVICVPIWWNTTSVERKPISYEKIGRLFDQTSHIPERESLMTLSENYDILLSLVLPDVNADWNIETHVNILEDWCERMKPFANFSVITQIIYHPGKLHPTKYFYQRTTWSKSDLSKVINNLEGRLQSNQNPNSKLVQAVVFVTERHVTFQDKKNSAILPDWGMFQFLHLNGENIEGKVLDSKKILTNIVAELDIIFGDVTEESKMLMIEKFVKSSGKALNSLSKLVSQVKNMVINTRVSENIEEAASCGLHALESERSLDERLSLARKSFRMSEGAFFDPSLLELLYFPEDQKFAIYIPFFLPLALPILSRFKRAVFYFKDQYSAASKLKSD